MWKLIQKEEEKVPLNINICYTDLEGYECVIILPASWRSSSLFDCVIGNSSVTYPTNNEKRDCHNQV